MIETFSGVFYIRRTRKGLIQSLTLELWFVKKIEKGRTEVFTNIARKYNLRWRFIEIAIKGLLINKRLGYFSLYTFSSPTPLIRQPWDQDTAGSQKWRMREITAKKTKRKSYVYKVISAHSRNTLMCFQKYNRA